VVHRGKRYIEDKSPRLREKKYAALIGCEGS